MNPNPYVFIVGCARSGTTLLQRMLDAHPLLAVIDETLWIPRPFERRRGIAADGTVTPKIVSVLSKHRRFPPVELNLEDIEALLGDGDSISYADFVGGIFDLYGRTKGKRLVGDKSPAYVRKMSTLHALWPRARFVHLIRDGRDVCLSVLNWKKVEHIARPFPTWDRDPVTAAALWWDRSVRLGREAGRTLTEDLYREVRYESLVTNPGPVCESLCDFLDLPFDDCMLRFHEGRTIKDPGLSAKRAWLPPTVGLRNWRSQMPPGDVERFEAAAGDLLEELGYVRSAARPSPEALAQASSIRDSFTEDVRRRRAALPERW